MTLETLDRANELSAKLEGLAEMREDVISEACFRRTRHRVVPEAIEAGKFAMLAVLDEAIDAARTELRSL